MEQPQSHNGEILLTLVKMKMPFGKYKDTLLCNLPVNYLEWFARKGFPKGKLGMLLQTILNNSQANYKAKYPCIFQKAFSFLPTPVKVQD